MTIDPKTHLATSFFDSFYRYRRSDKWTLCSCWYTPGWAYYGRTVYTLCSWPENVQMNHLLENAWIEQKEYVSKKKWLGITRHATFDWLAEPGIIFPEDDPRSSTSPSYSLNMTGSYREMIEHYKSQNHGGWTTQDQVLFSIEMDSSLGFLFIHGSSRNDAWLLHTLFFLSVFLSSGSSA